MTAQYPREITDGQRQAIDNSGKSKYQIAKEGNIAFTSLSRALKGKQKLQLGTVLKISRAIGMSIDKFETL